MGSGFVHPNSPNLQHTLRRHVALNALGKRMDNVADWWGIRYLVNIARGRKRRKHLAKRSRHATQITDFLRLAEYNGKHPNQFITAFQEAWPTLPPDVRSALNDHWRKLQSSWDDRRPDVEVILPVVFVHVDPTFVASERGYLLGSLLRARHWNGYSENFMQLDSRFASSHIVWFDNFDELPTKYATISVAMTLANYYLCIRGRADSADYITAMSADGAEELAMRWGFDVRQYYDWKNRDLS